MRFFVLAALVSTIALHGQLANVHVIRATHQQIVLAYDAPEGDDCKIEVSENESLTPVVHDVNGALFSGSDYDLSRPDIHVAGTSRTVVIGKRLVDAASDRKRYSRSLQAATPHWIRISDCGGSETVRAVTETVPFGPMLDLARPLTEPGAEGMYAAPTWNWFGDRNTESVIDPLTGVQIRKLQLATDWMSRLSRTIPFGTPISTAWTNPAGLTGAGVASYAGTDGATLYVPSTGWTSPSYIPTQLNVQLKAQVTGAITAEDSTLQVCFGNAIGCWTDWKDVDLGGKSLTDTVTVGPGSQPSLFWTRNGEWFIEGFHRLDMGRGIHIRRKPGASAGTVDIDSIATAGRLTEIGVPNTSMPKFCSDAMTEENGRRFVLCFFYPTAAAPRIHAIDVETGDSFFIGPAYFTRGVNGTTESSGTMGPGVWDKTDPRNFYTFAKTPSRIYRCTIAASALSQDYTGEMEAQPSSISCKNLTGPGFSLNEQSSTFGHPGWSPHWTTYAAGRWALEHMQNGKLVFAVRGQQDVGGWVAVFDPAASAPPACADCAGKLVALSPFGGSAIPQERKFCHLHSTNAVSDEMGDWVNQGTARQFKTQNQYYWGGPWHIKVKRHRPGASCDATSDNCDIPPGEDVFEIIPQGDNVYDFYDRAPGGPDDAVIPLEPGDLLLYTTGTALQKAALATEEYFEVVSVDRANHTVTMRRGNRIFESPWIQGSGFENPAQALYRNNPVRLPAGAELYGICRNTALNYDGKGEWIWNFTADPYGTTYVRPAHNGVGVFPPPNATYPASSGYASPNLMHFVNFGDHGTYSTGLRLQYSYLGCPKYYNDGGPNICYVAQTQPANINQLNSAVDLTVNVDPRWVRQPPPQQIITDTHVKLTARSAENWLDRRAGMDMRPLRVSNQARGNPVQGTSQVYKLTGQKLRRKIFPTVATSAPYALRDISGPADCSADPNDENCIDDSDMFTYCVALVDNECRGGSKAGDVYANTAMSTMGACNAAAGPSTETNAAPVCVHDNYVHTSAVIQTSLTEADLPGVRTRVLATYGVRPWNQISFVTGQALTNGKWGFYVVDVHGMQMHTLFKIPPMPATSSDSVLTLERVPVEIAHPSSGSFRIEFGYIEHGAAYQYRCATRQEACVVDRETVRESEPFNWASESRDKIRCHDGQCRAEVPRIPGRVVHMRAVFYDNDGVEVGSAVLPPR
jgi:hypothetical protein